MFGVEAIVFFVLRASEMRRTWIAVIPALLVVHAAMPGALGTIRASFFPKGGIIAQQQNASVGSGRLATLGPALHREFHDPVVGEGFGTRVTKATDLVPVPNGPILDDEWLGILLETGIVGAFSLGWMFVRFARRTGRAAKRDTSARGWLLTCFCASVTAFAVGMLFYDALGFYQSTFMMFIFLGLGVSTLLCPQHEWVQQEEAVGRARAKSMRPLPAST
jgi:O-antigen ligase